MSEASLGRRGAMSVPPLPGTQSVCVIDSEAENHLDQAISDLSQQLFLQATLQSFAPISGLTLFACL